MRLAVFLPNWIGDVVMATPAIRALRTHVGRGGQLIGVMRPYVAEVLAGTAWLDHRVIYHKPTNRFAMAERDFYRQLRAARPDRILLLTNSLRTAWMAWRSGARRRIGYRGDGRTWLLTTPVAPPRHADGSPVPTIEAYLRLAEAAGCDSIPSADRYRMELATTEADERAADAVWRSLDLPAGRRVVVLNSGGAFGAAKHWPPEHFAELAGRLAAHHGLSVLVNCGPAERAIARQIVGRARHPRVVGLDAIEQLPIGLTKACIRRSRLVVTTDSGPRFVAIAFGKPVVTLFGPTAPAATATYYWRETCLSLALECQPCMQRLCPLGHHDCMRLLSVDAVYAAVVAQLEPDAVSGAA